MTTAAPSDTAAVTPNSCASGIELKNPAVQPASRFPSQFDKKNTPIMRLTILVGASLVTALKPTGLRRSEEHTSELQSRLHLVCRLLLEKKKNNYQLSSHQPTVC